NLKNNQKAKYEKIKPCPCRCNSQLAQKPFAWRDDGLPRSVQPKPISNQNVENEQESKKRSQQSPKCTHFFFSLPWFISLRVQWDGVAARANSGPKVLLTVSEGLRKDTGINHVVSQKVHQHSALSVHISQELVAELMLRRIREEWPG